MMGWPRLANIKFRHCAFIVLLLIPPFAMAQISSAAVNPCSSPETILQRYIDALGGKAAVEKLASRKAEADESEPSSFNPRATNTYKYEFKWKAPNKAVIKSAHVTKLMPWNLGSWRFVFDGTAWSDSRGQRLPPQRNEQLWRKRLMFDYPYNAQWRVVADPLMFARPKALYSSFDVVNDSSQPAFCILRAQGWDNRLDRLYFDALTGLLKKWELQMVQPRNSLYITFQFDDYRQAGEVKFPFYVYVDYYKAAFHYTKVAHNMPLSDSDFRLK